MSVRHYPVREVFVRFGGQAKDDAGVDGYLLPANSFWRQKRRLELAATTLAMPAAAIDNVGIRWTTRANQG
jgi:hypothetical protein